MMTVAVEDACGMPVTAPVDEFKIKPAGKGTPATE